jgi:hypothetical protein
MIARIIAGVENSQPPPVTNQSNYPRGQFGFDAHTVRELVHGYFDISKAFLLTILFTVICYALMIGAAVLTGSTRPGEAPSETAGMIFLIGMVALVVVAVVSLVMFYKALKRAEPGMRWGSGTVILMIVVIFILGIIGLIIVQSLISSQLKQFGIQLGMFAQRKKILAQVDALEATMTP